MTSQISNTELIYDENLFIDKMSTNKGLKLLLKSQIQATRSIQRSITEIEIVINKILENINKYKNSRLIYVGAGTSGRIGVQDGSELFPTFGWPKKRVLFIIAGKNKALTTSVEGAEDDIISAVSQFKEKNVNKSDILIALAASGDTPFTVQIVKEARKIGSLTIGISNNLRGKLLSESEFNIFLDSGKEVLAGSTRLAAGTTQKICLNLISTMVMAKLGRVKQGRMNYLVANNKKLRDRKTLINNLLKDQSIKMK